MGSSREDPPYKTAHNDDPNVPKLSTFMDKSSGIVPVKENTSHPPCNEPFMKSD